VAESSGPGQMLFQFVRFWSRRWTGAGSGVDVERGRDVMVTEAVIVHSDRGGATINQVAEELGIDQSGASRMVADAVARGYLSKEPAVDARQRVVQVTEHGRELVTQAHAWQETTFANLTADWTPADVEQFTRLMHRLCRTPPPPPAR
jgi:DNA-binding MarR family transcriptional regulator